MRKALVLILLIAMTAIPLSARSAPYEGGSVQAKAGQNNEITALREKNSETYRLPNGLFECVVYAEDKYYEDASGDLVLIDNSIVPAQYTYAGKEYGFANKANSSSVRFAEDELSVLISDGAASIAFGIDTDDAVHPSVGGLKERGKIAGYTLSGENAIAYTGIFSSTDIVYEVKNGEVKEYIVLNDPAAPTEFKFTFDTNGLTAAYTENGTVSFCDPEGSPVFELGRLFAVDSADNYTEELTCSIKELGAGRIEITVALSANYAAAPERVYPILIDPTIMISGNSNIKDTFVSSKNPTSSNYYTEEQLRMGWNSGYNIRRTYIKFNLPGSIPSSAISEAYISLKKYGAGSTPSLKAYRVTSSWNQSSVNWNNKPGYSTTNASATASAMNNNWYRFYVTNIVKSWYAGTYNNYGFLIKDSDESSSDSWSTFYSSDAASPNKPELRITYSGSNYYVNMYVAGNINNQSGILDALNTVNSALNSNGYYGSSYKLESIPSNNITTSQLVDELNSKVIFSCLAHGHPGYIELPLGETFTMLDVAGLTADNLAFVYYGSCETGKYEGNGDNMVNATYAAGVDFVLGFTTTIDQGQTNLWTKHFMSEIAEGNTVNTAKTIADQETMAAYNVNSLSLLDISHVYYCGSLGFVPCPHD